MDNSGCSSIQRCIQVSHSRVAGLKLKPMGSLKNNPWGSSPSFLSDFGESSAKPVGKEMQKDLDKLEHISYLPTFLTQAKRFPEVNYDFGRFQSDKAVGMTHSTLPGTNPYGIKHESTGHSSMWQFKELEQSIPTSGQINYNGYVLPFLGASSPTECSSITSKQEQGLSDAQSSKHSPLSAPSYVGSTTASVPLKRFDSAYFSDHEDAETAIPAPLDHHQLSYAPKATLSDIKRNADNLEANQCSYAGKALAPRTYHINDLHPVGRCEDREFQDFHIMRHANVGHRTMSCPMGHDNSNIQFSRTNPSHMQLIGSYPGSGSGAMSQQSMDIPPYVHSKHRNDMSCCSHVENRYQGRPDMTGYRHFHFDRHRHCGHHRPAPADICGPYCREWHNDHIFPDDEPPPSHMMGKGKFNPLYKTEMCRNWTEMGHCRYGRTCQFAHGRAELRQVVKQSGWKGKTCGGAWMNDRPLGEESIGMEQRYGTSRFTGFFDGGFNNRE